MAEGFKTFCYPSVGFVTKRAIACGFLVMQMFYNPSKASIVGIFPSSFLLPSAVCRLPSPSQDHQKLPRTVVRQCKRLEAYIFRDRVEPTRLS
jgi:hypothetical protein